MKLRLLAVGVVVVTFASSVAVAAPAEDVTLKAIRIFDPGSLSYRVKFSGAISSGAANEYVTVMQQKCGQNFSTAAAGATTVDGGSWEVLSFSDGSGTYRARWKDSFSAPLTIRAPVRILLTHLSGGRHRVVVLAGSNLLRRPVELQRLAGGRWTRAQRARLEGGSAFVFYTTFTVRTRGLRLRIVVPRKTAAPCHVLSVSKTFIS
jgi:hypothetical protein